MHKLCHGDIAFTPPVAFQHREGQRIDVPVHYALLGKQRYGFVLGDYDPAQAVVIDPLMQSTNLGSNGSDQIQSMVVESTGQVLVFGNAGSTNFPGVSGGAQTSRVGTQDAFVARLSADLTMLYQATYLGGNGTETSTSMVVNSTGQVLVAGQTTSTDFPSTTGGAQAVYGGGPYDGFVARLSNDLTTLQQATYLGGGASDQLYAMVINSTGKVLVSGYAQSTDFPGTTGGAQAVYGGGLQDGFVSLLSADLTTLEQSTFLGGTGNDSFSTIALNTTGEVLVGGFTSSADVPGTTGGAQPVSTGGTMGLVARLNAGLTALEQATYLGGSGGFEQISAMGVNRTGQVLVMGYITSTDFPGTAGGAQSVNAGGFTDGFVTILSAGLTTSVQATYLGGNDFDSPNSMVVGSTDDVLVAGFTSSTNFPGTTGGVQATYAGGVSDGFVTRLSADLTTLRQATYLGGSDTFPIAWDSTGQVLVAGCTSSTDFPGTTGGAQTTNAGSSDGFVALLTPNLRATTSQTITFPAQASQTFNAGGSFAISPVATASSGLPVVYGSSTPAVCTVSGNTVTMLAIGTCTITADQAGNLGYDVAPQVVQNIAITMSRGASAAKPIPTLSQSLLVIMGLMLALLAGAMRERRQH